MNRSIGIVLIAIGIIGLAWGGLTYRTRENVVNFGPIQATREKTHDLPIPPIAGGLALVGGVALLAAGRKE